MSLNRRHFLSLATATIVSAALPKAAMAASLKLGPRITFPKSPGVGVLSPNVVPLTGAKFRAAFSPHDSGMWAISKSLDYSGDSGKPVGTRHTIGRGVFKSVDCSPVRLPTSRVAIYGEQLSVYFQALSAAGAPSGARIKISAGLQLKESLCTIQLTNGNFLAAWVNRAQAIVGRIVSAKGKGLSKVLPLAPGVKVSLFGKVVSKVVLCPLPNGAFAVAYNSNTGAKLARFTAKGAADGPARLVDERAANPIQDAGLIAMPDGDVMAVYRSDGLTKGQTIPDLRGRRFAPSGSATDFFQVPVFKGFTSLSEEPPLMVRLKSGDYLAAYQIYSRVDSRRQIMAVLLAGDGSVKSAPITIFKSTLSSGLNLHAAQLTDLRALANGKAVVAWSDGVFPLYQSYARTILFA